MAHTKAGGSTQNGRDSQSQRLGIKKYGGQRVITGNIIVRQRGTKFRPGNGVRMGKDNTLYAISNGIVQFASRKTKLFTGLLKHINTVNVVENQ